MNKLNLNEQIILDKEFNIEFKGYSASEVDGFLDLILQDYQVFKEMLSEYEQKITLLESEKANLKARIIEMEGKQKMQDLYATASNNFSSVDLIKRVSRLEQEIKELKK